LYGGAPDGPKEKRRAGNIKRRGGPFNWQTSLRKDTTERKIYQLLREKEKKGELVSRVRRSL